MRPQLVPLNSTTRCSCLLPYAEEFRDIIASECPRCTGEGHLCLAEEVQRTLATMGDENGGAGTPAGRRTTSR